MMHCPKCGRSQEPGSRFCQYCGTAIPEKKKKKAWPIVLVAAILVCALAAGLLLAFAAVYLRPHAWRLLRRIPLKSVLRDIFVKNKNNG